MSDLFADHPAEDRLPYDGKLYDLGVLDVGELDINLSDDLYALLLAALPWQSDIVRLFGKTYVTKRQVVWMGNQGLHYRYSGHTHEAIGWHPVVLAIKALLEKKLQTLDVNIKPNHFNTCLLNYYPTGSEGMGYHSDDEAELGDAPVIASLSLGATRKMVFKHKKTSDKVALYLTPYQVIIMAGDTQKYWKHSITKTKTVHEGRISLTFRRITSR